MQNVHIGGGFSDSSTMAKYAGMIGEIYGGGEYAVPESDLLSINPDVSHSILVIGGIAPSRVNGQDPHSASTVEIELRDLFQFPRKLRTIKKNTVEKVRKTLAKRKKAKKRGGAIRDGTARDGTPHDNTPVMKFRDIEDHQLKMLYGGDIAQEDQKDIVLTQPRADAVDDYAIASEIDKLHNGGSSDSSDSSDSSSSDSSDSSSSSSSDSSSSDSSDNEHVSSRKKKLAKAAARQLADPQTININMVVHVPDDEIIKIGNAIE